MGDESTEIGWWQASDGRWYPPESHPSVHQQTPASPAAPLSPEESDDDAPPPPWAPPAPAPPAGGGGAKRPALIGVVVVVVAALIAGGVVLATRKTSPSPNSVLQAVVNDFKADHFTAVCTLALASDQAKCRSDFKSPQLNSGQVHYVNIHVGLVRTNSANTEAVGQLLGKVTDAGRSATLPVRSDFATAKFTDLYSQALSSSENAADVALVKVNGKWYATGF